LSSFFQAIDKFNSARFFAGFLNTIQALGFMVKPLLEEFPTCLSIFCHDFPNFLIFNRESSKNNITKTMDSEV